MGTNNTPTTSPSDDEIFYIRRAALVSVGALYEDFPGPLSEEMIASADRIIAEKKSASR